MSRRHAKPRLSPIWMPYLRDKLADHLDHPPLPFHHVTDYQRELAGAWSNGDGLRHSPMWWVSRDMTTLAVEQARAFLAVAHGMGRQEYALCALLLLAGPRISEALRLDVEDFDRETSTLRYHRKGHYKQTVRACSAVASALRAHIGGRRHGPMFRAPRGGRLRADDARNTVRLIGAHVGRPDITPHSLRRTFCTLALDAGVAERDIMAACGWGTTAMVAYYDMANRAVTQQVGDGVAGLIGL